MMSHHKLKKFYEWSSSFWFNHLQDIIFNNFRLTKKIPSRIHKDACDKEKKIYTRYRIHTLCSKIMSKAIAVASSTSYMARAIFHKVNNKEIQILSKLQNLKHALFKKQNGNTQKYLYRIRYVGWKMLIFKFLIIQAIWTEREHKKYKIKLPDLMVKIS